MIKNAKLSGYYFYMNLNIWGDFQICITVPLNRQTYRSKIPQSVLRTGLLS